MKIIEKGMLAKISDLELRKLELPEMESINGGVCGNNTCGAACYSNLCGGNVCGVACYVNACWGNVCGINGNSGCVGWVGAASESEDKFATSNNLVSIR